jgi:hypothetical protein
MFAGTDAHLRDDGAENQDGHGCGRQFRGMTPQRVRWH